MMDNFYMYGYSLPVWNLGKSSPLYLPRDRAHQQERRSQEVADFISRRFKEYHLCDKESPRSKLWCRPRLDDLMDDHSLYHCHLSKTQDGEEQHESQVGRDENPRCGETGSSAIPE